MGAGAARGAGAALAPGGAGGRWGWRAWEAGGRVKSALVVRMSWMRTSPPGTPGERTWRNGGGVGDPAGMMMLNSPAMAMECWGS